MIKKLVALSLIIFFVGVTAVLAAGLVVREINKNNSSTANLANGNNNDTATQTSNPQATLIGSITSDLVLNMAEVAKHNTANNCWMVIDNKVYDVTNSIGSHPGGANEIIKFCGMDGTVAFQTKDSRGRDHSQTAYAMLAPYFIGNLNQKLTAPKTSHPVSKTSPNQTANNTSAPTPVIPAQTGIQPPTPASTSNTALTMAELSKHNNSGNCWLLISGRIYNVTSYIGSHPGGANEIIKFCGTDATVAFNTKDGRGNSHSSAANAMLAAYYIGDLNQNVTTQQLNTSVNQTDNTPPPTNNGGDDNGGNDD